MENDNKSVVYNYIGTTAQKEPYTILKTFIIVQSLINSFLDVH